MNQLYDVCMLGLGPVGAVSGACYAKQGFSVIGVDINPARINALKAGKAPFVEPGFDELIKQVCDSGHFRVTTELAPAVHASRIVMIAVGTPTPKDAPDLSQLDQVCQQIGEALKGKQEQTVIVIRSTIPPGTIRNRLTPIIEQASGKKAGTDFHMASNPEFLREGMAIKDFFHTGRVVIGSDSEEAAAQVEALYRDVQADARLRVALESAEFAKYVDNTWHALKVAFANEIGRVCTAFGGNPKETTEIFLKDDKLNISAYYLKPGFAFGGSCLPKDTRGLSYLAGRLGVDVPIVDAIMPSNDAHIALGLHAILATQPERVGLLGVAFKEHVDDLRESPALEIAAQLSKQGIRVQAHDFAYPEGETLQLPKTHQALEMKGMEPLAQFANTLVIMHRLPEYFALAERHAAKGGAVVDLTTLPPKAEASLPEEELNTGELRGLVAR